MPNVLEICIHQGIMHFRSNDRHTKYGIKKRKAERLTLPFPVRLSHFNGVARTTFVYRYALATFVIHT